jgi:hypothetical protein
VPVVTLDVSIHPRYEDLDLSEVAFRAGTAGGLRSMRFENAVEERMNSSIRVIDRLNEA